MIFFVLYLRKYLNYRHKIGFIGACLSLFVLLPNADPGGIDYKVLLDPNGRLSQIMYFNGNGAVTQYHQYALSQKGKSFIVFKSLR